MTRHYILALLVGFFPTLLFLLSFSAVLAGPLQEVAQTKTQPQQGKRAEAEIVLKRRQMLDAEELRKQLLAAAEVGLNQNQADLLYKAFKVDVQKRVQIRPDLGAWFLTTGAVQSKRPEIATLPWRAGAQATLGKEPAENLHVISLQLRAMLRAATPNPKDDPRPDIEKLRAYFDQTPAKAGKGGFPGLAAVAQFKPEHWTKPAAVPALVQLLQVENEPVRLLMVERLAKIKGKEASVALAKRALFDLSPEVREKAVKTLAGRPTEEFLPTLLDGLSWPWVAAAEHAAEAITALRLQDALPELVELLKLSDPSMPFAAKVKATEVYYLREVVRMNHLSNCMVCHAPSQAKEDLVRGRVPLPGEDPPPLYYQERDGLFVHADITYLQQDFSLMQPVALQGKWPAQQRYDYLVRERELTKVELKLLVKLQKEEKLPIPYGQRDAVLYTLRELTKTDAGTGYEDWSKLLPTIIEKKK